MTRHIRSVAAGVFALIVATAACGGGSSASDRLRDDLQESMQLTDDQADCVIDHLRADGGEELIEELAEVGRDASPEQLGAYFARATRAAGDCGVADRVFPPE